jgi:hypothetical protein
MMQQQEQNQHVQQESEHEAGQKAVCQQQKATTGEFNRADTNSSTQISSSDGTLSSFQSADTMEQGLSQPKQEDAIVGGSRCGVRSRPTLFAVCCAGGAAILIVVAAVLLWPRDPAWHLTKIDMDTSKFIAVMTGQGNVTEPLPLVADVSFWNPNLIGATTEPGAIKVFFGSEVMCHGTAGATTVGPRSTSTLRTELVVQFNEALAQKIMATVMANNFQLNVSADARVVVPMGPVRVKVDTHCKLTTDALKVLTDPTGVISKRECTYSYSL